MKRALIILSPLALLLGCQSEEALQPEGWLDASRAYSTGLPVVTISTPDSLSIASKTVWTEQARMEITGPDGSSFVGLTRIRGRGNVTWKRYPKKPYSLKLYSKAAILGLPRDKRWVLLANWADRTLLRNDVALEVARRVSPAWVPRGQPVELVVNGRWRGAYFLCEKIKVGAHRVDIDEMTPDDNAGEALTGGYLLELDKYFDENNKFRSVVYDLPYVIHSPDESSLTSEQYGYIKSYIDSLEQSLSDNAALGRGEFSRWLDVGSLADWWIINELVYNKEVSQPRSVYVYKPRGGPLHFGPAWDYDWGTFTAHRSLYVAENAPYLGQLFGLPAFRAIACQRWRAVRDSLTTIPEYIDRQAAHIRRSWEMNSQMWPIKHQTSNKDEALSFDEAVERMKQNFLLRWSVIDTYLSTE